MCIYSLERQSNIWDENLTEQFHTIGSSFDGRDRTHIETIPLRLDPFCSIVSDSSLFQEEMHSLVSNSPVRQLAWTLTLQRRLTSRERGMR